MWVVYRKIDEPTKMRAEKLGFSWATFIFGSLYWLYNPIMRLFGALWLIGAVISTALTYQHPTADSLVTVAWIIFGLVASFCYKVFLEKAAEGKWERLPKKFPSKSVAKTYIQEELKQIISRL